jgi:hypothetical protein
MFTQATKFEFSKNLRQFPCTILVVRISLTRTGELNSQDQQSHMWVEGTHTTGFGLVPRRDRLRPCCHHTSVIQPLARCLTPWLRWTTALFVVLESYPPLQRGRLRSHFGGVCTTYTDRLWHGSGG